MRALGSRGVGVCARGTPGCWDQPAGRLGDRAGTRCDLRGAQGGGAGACGGGGAGGWAGSGSEIEKNVSVSLFYLPPVSSRAVGSPSALSPHGVSQISPFKAPGPEAWAAQRLGAASSAEAPEQSGLRKALRHACFLLGPAWAPAVAAGSSLAWPAVPGPPTLFLSLCPSSLGPCSPNVSETGVSGKTSGQSPRPRVLPGPCNSIFSSVCPT